MEVSDPTSSKYGNHWTPNEVMDMFAPSDEAVKDIFEWLEDAGFFGDRVKYTKSKGVSDF